MRPTRRVAHKSPISKRCRRRSASSCAFCERGIARARSDLPAKPLGARRLPQQRAQSGCKGLRRACAEQAGASGRGTGFEGSKPAAHLSKPSKTPNSSGDPRRKRTSNHPASWVASHQGRVRFMVRISAVRSRRPAVCRVRSCHGRAYCISRSQGLAKTPKNGYAGGSSTQPRAVQRSTAPSALTEQSKCRR